MENYKLVKDIHILYVNATSFPEGVLKAHQKLHSTLPGIQQRQCFGLSRPENGKIQYMAGAEEMHEREAKEKGLKSMIIQKGNYHSILIRNYNSRIESIGEAFEKLIQLPDIDPQGYCVELYSGENDVRCMVRIKD